MRNLPLLAAALVFSSWQGMTAQAQSTPCDRNCMSRVLDAYLNAVLKHDPGQAPLSPTFRVTENGKEVSRGAGLWQSSLGLGPMQRRYFDPEAGQAAFYGTLIEKDGEALLSLRLRFSGEKIGEAEAIIARKGEALYNPAGAIADQPRTDAPIEQERRTDRAAMTRTASLYFDAISNVGDPAAIPSIKGCDRIENGTRMTNRRSPTAGGNAADETMSGDCTAKLSGMPIKAVAYRRFPVIDTEAGVILGVGLFQRPPGAVWRDGSPRKRNLIHEYFVLDGDRIGSIFAVMHYREPDEPDDTGW